MSITRVYNSSLMEAKDNRIHQLETELAEAREDLDEMRKERDLYREQRRCECSAEDACRFARERDEARKDSERLREELERNTQEIDSYGVPGSDFRICSYCRAESGAGVLDKGIPHEKDCILYAAMSEASPCPTCHDIGMVPSDEPGGDVMNTPCPTCNPWSKPGYRESGGSPLPPAAGWAEKKLMTNEQRKTIKEARRCFPGAKIRHVFPNAYCVAKTASCCAVFVTPPTDREPLVKSKPGVLVQNASAAIAEVGKWYQIVYVSTRINGEPFILPNAQS